MDKEKRDRLKAAGFRIGDAEDFLELTEAERKLVELRVTISRAVRQQREALRLTQKQLADRLKSSQSRIAKIEAGAADVSLDLSFRAFFAAGGKLGNILRKSRAATEAAASNR
jgi:ribosome-binding protein aMBF1 (putative translation factor)